MDALARTLQGGDGMSKLAMMIILAIWYKTILHCQTQRPHNHGMQSAFVLVGTYQQG